MPYNDLILKISQADICLGMFGNTDKAKRAGAFKVTEAMAMRKAVITADTPAMREFLADGTNCLFCQAANEVDLVDKILELKNNEDLRKNIAEAGYQTYLQKLTPKVLGHKLQQIIETLK